MCSVHREVTFRSIGYPTLAEPARGDGADNGPSRRLPPVPSPGADADETAGVPAEPVNPKGSQSQRGPRRPPRPTGTAKKSGSNGTKAKAASVVDEGDTVTNTATNTDDTAVNIDWDRAGNDPVSAPVAPQPAPTSGAVDPTPPPSSDSTPRAPRPDSASGVRKGRRVRRVVRRIDLWSVLKLAIVLFTCLYIAVLVTMAVIWNLAYTTGQIDKVQSFLSDVGLENYRFYGDQMFRAAAAIGAVGVLAATLIAVITAALVNVISELTGGIRLVVIEEDPPPRRR